MTSVLLPRCVGAGERHGRAGGEKHSAVAVYECLGACVPACWMSGCLGTCLVGWLGAWLRVRVAQRGKGTGDGWEGRTAFACFPC